MSCPYHGRRVGAGHDEGLSFMTEGSEGGEKLWMEVTRRLVRRCCTGNVVGFNVESEKKEKKTLPVYASASVLLFSGGVASAVPSNTVGWVGMKSGNRTSRTLLFFSYNVYNDVSSFSDTREIQAAARLTVFSTYS